MSSDITGSARSHGGAVSVEVLPGGGLRTLTLGEPALGLGGAALAGAILDAVREATAQANQRTRLALAETLAGLGDRDLEVLGLGRDDAMTERVEATTPDSWKALP